MENTAVLISIVTSLVASIVFWFVFNLIPAAIKYFRIRPRVEDDIIDIKLHLFFFIQIPFLQSVHTASFFQSEIENRRLCFEDYTNALYGKCLSEERCNGEFSHRLLPVGEKLISCANELDKRLDRIQRYAEYLYTREVLLLKEIGEKIHAYDYVEHTDIIDGAAFVTVDPTISHMKANFYETYRIYHELKRLCDSFLFVKRNDYEKYRIAKARLEKKKYISYGFLRLFLDRKQKLLIDVRYNYLKNNNSKAKKKLVEYLQVDKQRLVSLRAHIDYLLSNDEYYKLLIDTRGRDEVQELMSFLRSEAIKKNQFNSRNTENRRIIEEMIGNTPKIDEYDEATIMRIKKLFDGYL